LSKTNSSPCGRPLGVLRASRWSDRRFCVCRQASHLQKSPLKRAYRSLQPGLIRNLSKTNSSPCGRPLGVLRASRWSNRRFCVCRQASHLQKSPLKRAYRSLQPGLIRNLSKTNSSPCGRPLGVLRASRWSNRRFCVCRQASHLQKSPLKRAYK